MHFDSLKVHRQGTFIRLLKMKPGGGSDDVDSPWSDTDLKDGPILLKVFLGKVVQRSAEPA